MSKPVKGSVITCDWGVPGSWSAGYHTGEDWRAAVGTTARATIGGRVVATGDAGDYGLWVVVETKRGPRQLLVRCYYCHLSRIDVQVGQRVKRKQRLGLTGDTGRTFGAHLHYEERRPPFNYNDVDRDPFYSTWFPLLKKGRRRRKPRADHPNAIVKRH